MIYLIGFMGSGKTSVGIELSKKLHYNFIDTDKLIEKQQGVSIEEIFLKEGEKKFRYYEKNIIRYIQKEKKNTIISTGGGLVNCQKNIDTLNSTGITIYLKTSEKNLLDRLKKKERPLIKNLPYNELKVFISNILKSRETYYLQAQHIISTDNLNIKEISRKISSLILPR